VGSHVVVSLIRSGVLHLKLIDFDRISLSALNRHAFAQRKDVGLSKVQGTKNYIEGIFPEATVEICESYVTKDNVKEFLEGEWDYVIDCIDNVGIFYKLRGQS
jgi:tRNA A37 threonylcarbamoyladenosine dehydratase